MSPEVGYRVITASVTPVVVISANGLLCLAFFNRLATIVSRLRAVQRERLQIQEELIARSGGDEQAAFRHTSVLGNLSQQTTRIIMRARLIRFTLLMMLASISALVACSTLDGLALLHPSLQTAAALLFLCGMGLLFGGILCAIAEMFVSLGPAELEMNFVSGLAFGPDDGEESGIFAKADHNGDWNAAGVATAHR